MGLRHSTAANIVFRDNVPLDVVKQLDAICSTQPGDPLHDALHNTHGPYPGVSTVLGGLARDHRAYGEKWLIREAVIPGKHYRLFGTTKNGDIAVDEAIRFLYEYLDVGQSWFLSICELGELQTVRWLNGSVLKGLPVIRKAMLRWASNAQHPGHIEFEEFDGDDIPAVFAERLANTSDPMRWSTLLAEISRPLTNQNKTLVSVAINKAD